MVTVAASLQQLAGNKTVVAFKRSFEQKVNAASFALATDIAATHRENGTKSVDAQRMVLQIQRAAKEHTFKNNNQLDKEYELKNRVAPLSRSEREDMGLGAQTGYGWVNFTK